MKVKDLERTANIAWSPSNEHPIYLAAGTAAQQVDASFNTNAVVEIYALNLSEPGLDMEMKVSVQAEHRFHKLIWGSYDKSSDYGTIVGGCDGGLIEIYNVSKLLNNERGLVAHPTKHTGPVHALDFNPFQSNLLASGAGESEIYIWDLNNASTHMTPGVKSQPYEDVQCVAWNRQVQHILASTFPSKCVVWDLRKNEPIIKLSDTISRIRWKVVAWHPEVATQLCLASEEDQAPVVQLWDLRFATSPLKTLENHQRGILSIAWCQQDANLLVSCGKDNRIVCWNPNSNTPGGEVLSEVAKTNQWNFDVTWCPKNPALIACPNFDGHVSVYSVMGGKIQQVQTTNKIADSFPGMEGYAQAPEPQQTAPASVDLSKPPKWLKRPVGARFGFGGKLITFATETATQTAPNQSPTVRSVFVSQVITEPELVNQSAQLEQALEYGNFTEYCRNKADLLTDQHKRNIWYFLKANFEEDPRGEILNLLGYKKDEINNKLNEIVGSQANVDGLTDQCDYSDGENNFSSKGSPDYSPGSYENSFGLDQFGSLSQQVYQIKTGDDVEGLITQALLLGNLDAAVELCLKAQRFADAIIIAISGGSELLARTQYKYLQQSKGYVSSLISALVTKDWTSVINNCDIDSWKEALAATLTHSSNEDLPKLCELLGNRLEAEGKTNPKYSQDAQLCYICAGDFERLVNSWSNSIKKSSNELQELVELVTFLQKSVERQGRRVEITGSLADLLSYYASILASQGNLAVALSYLGSSQDKQVANLRERLSISLGYKPAYHQVPQRSRHSSRQSFSSYLNPVTPPVSIYNNNFNTALPNTPINQPWQTQNQAPVPTQPFSPPPVVQPPRPTSVGSAHGGGISSRAKYVVDPSVHSNNPYGSRNQFNTNAYMPQNVPINQPPAATNTHPLVPNLPPMPNPTTFHNPLPPVNHFDEGEPAVPTFAPPPQSGWNDPPALRRSIPRLPSEGNSMSATHAGTRRWKNHCRKVEPQPDYVQQDPITHPLYGTVPAQTVPPSNGFMEPIQGQQPFTPNTAYNPNFEHQPMQPPIQTTGFMPPPNPNVYNPIPNIQAPKTPTPAPVVESPAPIQKAPLSGEHKVMQIVFDDLRNRCSTNANNPQTKRKLEDVGKKLEYLYDLLRDDKLSPNTLSGLHQLVQLVQSGDYPNSISLHTQLVSGPDFAQIASFMPGLKVLIQCALQLQVYLR